MYTNNRGAEKNHTDWDWKNKGTNKDSKHGDLYSSFFSWSEAERRFATTNTGGIESLSRQNEEREPWIFTDVASGLNTKHRGLKKLCQAIEERRIDRVIVTYPDRLTRFGFKYLEQYFQSHETEISVINDTVVQSMEEELVKDLIVIVTSFSGRIHGLRSHRNKKSIL